MSAAAEPPVDLEAPLDRQPGTGRPLRYMGRRRVNRTDRNGDPLDGVVNLFDVAIVLAVAFLLAALTGIGLTSVLTTKDITVVTNPGQPDMQVITKKGTTITKLDLTQGQQVSGMGTLIGQFWRLPDGTTVYVPSGGVSTPQSPVTPAPSVTPGVVATPTPPGTVITPTPAGAPSTVVPPTNAPGATTP